MEGTILFKPYGNIHFKKWEVKEPKANILIVHGLGEHLGRYEEFSAYMTSEKIQCISFDLPGHGKSEGKRGNIRNLDDIVNIADKLLDQENIDNIVVFGHSLGGLIAAYYVLQSKHNVKKAIISAAAFGMKSKVPSVALPLIKIARGISPSFTVKNGITGNMLSHRSDIAEAYDHDKLVHPFISFSLFLDSIRVGDYCFSHFLDYKIPILVVHGEEDPIMDKKYSIAFYNMLPNAVKELKIIKNSYHEPHNEVNNREVYKIYKDFILSKG